MELKNKMRLRVLGLLCLLPALSAAGPAPVETAGWEPAPLAQTDIHADGHADAATAQMAADTPPSDAGAFVPAPTLAVRPADAPPPLRVEAQAAPAAF